MSVERCPSMFRQSLVTSCHGCLTVIIIWPVSIPSVVIRVPSYDKQLWQTHESCIYCNYAHCHASPTASASKRSIPELCSEGYKPGKIQEIWLHIAIYCKVTFFLFHSICTFQWNYGLSKPAESRNTCTCRLSVSVILIFLSFSLNRGVKWKQS